MVKIIDKNNHFSVRSLLIDLICIQIRSNSLTW